MVSFLLGGRPQPASLPFQALFPARDQPLAPVQAPSHPASDKQPEREETHPNWAGPGPGANLHLASSPGHVPVAAWQAPFAPGLGLGTILSRSLPGPTAWAACASSQRGNRNTFQARIPEPGPFPVAVPEAAPLLEKHLRHLCCPQPPA